MISSPPNGADFLSDTAAQIFAVTRRRRFSPKFRPAHGDTDSAPKFVREKKKLRAEGQQSFFRDRLGRTGIYDRKGLFYDRKGLFYDQKGGYL